MKTMQFVGQDPVGNRYYLSDESDYLGRKRRSVEYAADKDPSTIPPMWHAWLHYLSDIPPSQTAIYEWQVQHQPNQTGTDNAHHPTWHDIEANYKPWKPEQ